MTNLTPHDDMGRPRLNAKEREEFRRELRAAEIKRKAANAAKVREKRAAKKNRRGEIDNRRTEARSKAEVQARIDASNGQKVKAGYWKRQVC